MPESLEGWLDRPTAFVESAFQTEQVEQAVRLLLGRQKWQLMAALLSQIQDFTLLPRQLAVKYFHRRLAVQECKELCDTAAKCGKIQILKLAHNLGCDVTYETGLTAARNYHHNCLRYCNDVLDEGFGEVLCQKAAACGQVGLFKLARDMGILFRRRYATTAIKKGHLECLEMILDSVDEIHESDGESECSEPKPYESEEYEYLDLQECRVFRYSRLAVRYGQSHVLKFLLTRYDWHSEDICFRSVELGKLDCLKCAHECSCYWGPETCEKAARAGSLSCLQYAYEHGCEWDSRTLRAAYQYKQVRCLEYAHRNGCPWDASTCELAAMRGDVQSLRRAQEHNYQWDAKTCKAAAETGHLNCLRLAHEQGCPWDASTFEAAAGNGHLECLKYAHDHGCPPSQKAVDIVIRNIMSDGACSRNLKDCLQYLSTNVFTQPEYCNSMIRASSLKALKLVHENGFPWDETTTATAAAKGNLECLRYAHKHGCPWNEKCCEAAARRGSLDCLKYAHRNCCPWNSTTLRAAALACSLRCLRYAVENGCAWDKETTMALVQSQCAACIRYACENHFVRKIASDTNSEVSLLSLEGLIYEIR